MNRMPKQSGGLLHKITAATAEYYGVTSCVLRGPNRSPLNSESRAVAMYLCRQLSKRSFPEIGMFFGNRHHTTVLHLIRKVESWIIDAPLDPVRGIGTACQTIRKMLEAETGDATSYSPETIVSALRAVQSALRKLDRELDQMANVVQSIQREAGR
jgi:hypothetical protein